MALPPNDPISLILRKKYPRKSFVDINEVASNRRGEITPAQLASLKYELAQQSLTALIFVILGAGLPLYIFVIGLLTPHNNPRNDDAVWLVLVFGAALLGLPGIRQGIRLFQAFFAARQEMAANNITQSDGAVTWTGDIYAAFVGKRRLKPIYIRLGLLPGKYHFFYLRQSRWLLSAEKLVSNDDFDSTQELQRVLAVTNRFSLEDLEANREGRMTTRQRFRLWFLIATFFQMSSPMRLIPYSIFILWVCIVLSQFGLLPFVLAIAGMLALLAIVDATVEPVASVESIAHRQVPQHRGDTHKYLLGNLRFRVSGQAYNALIVGQRYRVYYARYSKKLLSIEPLTENTNHSP